MKRYTKARAIGRVGVGFVSNVVNEAGSIFREVAEDVDLGIDGYIEFVDQETATGNLVGVQIKAGSSYLIERSDGPYFHIAASKGDFGYWNAHPIPVALIVYDPESKTSGWLDLTGYIKRFPEALKNERTVVTINGIATPFNINTFQEEFQDAFKGYILEADFFEYAELFASHSLENKLQGLSGLLSHDESKFSELTCFLLTKHLFHPELIIREVCVDVLSRYLNHPEVSYRSSKRIRKYIDNLLADLGKREISQLIDLAWIDKENFMQRGSIGQSATVIITNIPTHEEQLYYIAIDPFESYERRWGALSVIGLCSIQSAIEKINVEFETINWGEVIEAAQWIKELYNQQ
jgi:hypothetical protein